MNTRRDAMLAEVLQGLSDDPRHLPPKFFYDALGSKLFDAITVTPEYYPTRCEREILEARAPELAARLDGALLVELGAGVAEKVSVLLDAAKNLRGYVPVDIDGHTLERAAARLRRRYPNLPVTPEVADLTQRWTPPDRPADVPIVVFYPGSSIGNFDPEETRSFLAGLSDVLRAGDGFLVGFDLEKETAVLELAYDDPAGVTASFNRNMLARLNRDLGATFDVAAFAHEAVYDREHHRIDIHLRATRAHDVVVGGQTFRFEEGDAIHTESSYKFTRQRFGDLAARAGWAETGWWTDSKGWFGMGWYART